MDGCTVRRWFLVMLLIFTFIGTAATCCATLGKILAAHEKKICGLTEDQYQKDPYFHEKETVDIKENAAGFRNFTMMIDYGRHLYVEVNETLFNIYTPGGQLWKRVEKRRFVCPPQRVLVQTYELHEYMYRMCKIDDHPDPANCPTTALVRNYIPELHGCVKVPKNKTLQSYCFKGYHDEFRFCCIRWFLRGCAGKY